MRLATNKRMGLMWNWKPFHRPDVEKLLEFVAAGKLRPSIDRASNSTRSSKLCAGSRTERLGGRS
jgi:hypothetical protein